MSAEGDPVHLEPVAQVPLVVEAPAAEICGLVVGRSLPGDNHAWLQSRAGCHADVKDAHIAQGRVVLWAAIAFGGIAELFEPGEILRRVDAGLEAVHDTPISIRTHKL